MNTAFILMAQYGAHAIIPLDLLRRNQAGARRQDRHS